MSVLPFTKESRMPERRDPNQRIDGHEELCAERYRIINLRLGRLEAILWTVAGTMILTLLTVIFKLKGLA